MRFALVTLMLFAGLAASCKKHEPVAEPVVAAPAAAPTSPPVTDETGQVVVRQVARDGKLSEVNEETGRQIAEAVGQLTHDPAEEPSAADLAGAKDPAKIVGRWKIKQLLYMTNGKAGEPSEPLVPTVWNFTKDGRLLVEGGNALKLRYVFTGATLIVTGFGPKLVYEISKLTAKDLEVVTKISAGSVQIENTTLLTRAD